jgi:hypothetical protein
MNPGPHPRPAEQRFWEKVDRRGPDECWIWLASTKRSLQGDNLEYGAFGMDRKVVPSHRFAYELQVGPIPKLATIYHECRNHLCMNPKHMKLRLKRAPAQRFWEKVGPHDDPNSCWLWQGATNGIEPLKYGSFRLQPQGGHKGTTSAHRFAYELLVGPVPKGMTLDHVKARGCTSTLCVNPAHLEPVTNKVNILRGTGPCAVNARRQFCRKGHPFDEANTRITPSGGRVCRSCRNAYNRLVRKRSRQEG